MPIKIIGSILLAVAGALAAVSVRVFHRRRIDTLDGFISLIFYIKGQVDCYAMPIGDIIASLPPEMLRALNCPRGALTLEELIDESRLYLDRESLRLVTAFSGEFGSVFREEQMRRCDHYIAMLSEVRQRVGMKCESEARAGSALCICTALCLAVLLW